MHYIYLVRCVDNSLYCGQTTDLSRRVNEHNFDGKKSAKYTKGRRPVVLVHSEEFATFSEALKRELKIKRLPKAKKEVLVNSGYSHEKRNYFIGIVPNGTDPI
ncbi:MAG: GIY-YIG nuclease family protein [Patescibacteria group bacterium]